MELIIRLISITLLLLLFSCKEEENIIDGGNYYLSYKEYTLDPLSGNIINSEITIYRQVDDSIMSNIKKYSKKWWIKRKEAHEFMKDFFIKNQLVYENKFDYYLTDKISKFLL